MDRLKINSGLIELEMCNHKNGSNMYIYDKYTDNYVTMFLSVDELTKIRDYIDVVLEGVIGHET